MGSTGFLSLGVGLRTFNERVATDVVAPRPEVIVEMSRLNDNGVVEGEALILR